MYTIKTYFILASLLFAAGLSAQEVTSSNVELQTFSFQKFFLDNGDIEKNIWELKEYSCEVSLPSELRNTHGDIPKYSQANLLALRRSNTRVFGLHLNIPEKQYFELEPGEEYKDVALIDECVKGYKRSIQAYVSEDTDYFVDLLRYLRFVSAQEDLPYYANGRKLSFRVLRKEADLDEVLADPTLMAATVSIFGAHNLSSYFYIKKNLVNSADYHKIVLENLERLKGARPLIDHTEEYLGYPISHLRLASTFMNGLGGDISSFRDVASTEQSKHSALKEQEGLSSLGQKLVREMLNQDNGRRILVDVSGLHPNARNWIYNHHNRLRYHGDTIPILALGVTAHGESWESGKVGSPRAHTQSFLAYDKASLAREDVRAILESGGLIGITTDRKQLTGGNKGEKLLASLQEGSAEYQAAAVNLMLANLLRCVQAVQDRSVWNHLAISSGFDAGQVPFGMYAQAGKLEDLRKDVKAYFENPQNIFDLYTGAQVKELMYGYEAEEIVDKLFSSNGLRFMRKRLKSMEAGAIEESTAQQD